MTTVWSGAVNLKLTTRKMNFCFDCSSFSLLLLSVWAVGSVVVDQGQNVTLNCSYNAGSNGPLKSCWSRGELPSIGMCGSNLIISSDGTTVTSQTSQRYVLAGHLGQGDVSLTILNVLMEDEGTYGCRVDIPGWNNDLKHQITLKVLQVADPTSASALHTTSTSDHVTSANYTTSSEPVTTSGQIWTSSSGSKAEENRSSTVLLVCVLLTVLCITTAILLIIIWRWRLFPKMTENQFSSEVQFRATSSTLQLEQRSRPEENIYN